MIIFLHGDDTYRSRAKLQELRERFLRDVDPSGANLVMIDGTTAAASEVWGAIAAQSFLVRKRMVIIERIGDAKSDPVRTEVAAFFPKIPDDVMVVFWESVSRNPASKKSPSRVKRIASKRSARTSKRKATGVDPLFPLLLQEQCAQEFAPLTGAELERWVMACAKTRGAMFAPGACRALCAMVGSDLWRMTQEVEKLTLAAARASNALRSITSALMCELVDGTPTDNIFAFVDALGRGDGRAALAELARLEATGAEPGMLVGMIARQLRLLIMAADCLRRGVPAGQLATELGCPPFVASKLAEQARTQSLATLLALHPKLVELDYALKSSRAPREALVELFCLEATA